MLFALEPVPCGFRDHPFTGFNHRIRVPQSAGGRNLTLGTRVEGQLGVERGHLPEQFQKTRSRKLVLRDASGMALLSHLLVMLTKPTCTAPQSGKCLTAADTQKLLTS